MNKPVAPLLFRLAPLISAAAAVSQPMDEEPEPALEEPAAAPQEPQPDLQRPTVWREPTDVRVKVYAIDVDGVNSADQNFPASIYYEGRWNTPFLRHEVAGPLHRLTSSVWAPRRSKIVSERE